MKKRHFIAIAKTLASTRPDGLHGLRKVQWTLDVRRVADVIESFNPRFKFDTFFRACNE